MPLGRTSHPLTAQSGTWRFVETQQAVPPPSDRGEPRPRRDDRRWSRRSDDRGSPPREPLGGRARIEPADTSEVLPKVLEDVDDRIPDFARSRKSARMVTVRPDPSATTERAIDRLRNANGESLKTAAQCHRIVRFDEQVDVIPLHAEVQEAKSSSGNSDERCSYGTEDVVTPQHRQIPTGAERHVDWAVAIVRSRSSVRDTPSPASGLASGTFSPAAPGWWRGQLQLSSSTPHVESGTYYTKLASMSSTGAISQALRAGTSRQMPPSSLA